MFKYFNFTRLFHYIFLSLSKMPMRAHYRWRFLKLGGVKFNFANGRGECYIYKRVSIDTVAPDLLILGNRVTLTEGTTILTHFLDPTAENGAYPPTQNGLIHPQLLLNWP